MSMNAGPQIDHYFLILSTDFLSLKSEVRKTKILSIVVVKFKSHKPMYSLVHCFCSQESLSNLSAEMESREAQLREEVISKEAEINRLTEELRRCQGLLQEGAGQVSHRYYSGCNNHCPLFHD